MQVRTETTDKILSAARDVFCAVGFAGARVDEIARQAGVNKAALYYHFGDKQALYAAVLHSVVGEVALRNTSNLASDLKPEDKLRTYIRILIKAFDESPQLPRIMMRELAGGGQNLPQIFIQDFLKVIGTIASIIDEGVRAGCFVPVTPLLLHSMTIGALAVHKVAAPVFFAHAEQSGPLSPDAAREIEDVIMRAILK